MYIETSSPRVPDEKARLRSGLLASTEGRDYCFEVWYHMFGPDIADLNIYISTLNEDTLVSLQFLMFV